MQAFLGIIFHVTGGVAAGSFYMPYKRVKGWNWESYWIIGGIFSWLIVPYLIAWVTLPGFSEIISEAPFSILKYPILFGILWGMGGLTYGLGIRYLGMSLGNTVVLGFCSAFGALIPAIFYDFFPNQGKTTFSDMLNSTWGQVVLLGVLMCLGGITICGWAGMMKERELKKNKERGNSEFNLGKGLIVAILSGILSACFNFGIEAGKPLAEEAIKLGLPPLFQNNVIFVVLLWGGFLTNLIWCLFLNYKHKSYGDYYNIKTPLSSNYLFCALAGATWFMQFFFYGMGESKLGNGASSWILHMASIILVGNFWGLVLKEWRGVSKKTKLTVVAGILTLLMSVMLVGYGNSLS